MRQLTPDKHGRSLSQPTWSPDGEQLACVDSESVQSAAASRYGGLFVIADDGSEIRRLMLGPVSDPGWSPDGREIVFVRGEDLPTPEANDDVWVIDLATSAERQLTKTPPGTFEAGPAWSPDGSQIAFARYASSSQYDGAASIHLMNRDGTGERQILAHKLFAYAPYSLAWSPDGKTIAFETSPSIECVSISLLDVARGSVRPLTSCMRPREVTWRLPGSQHRAAPTESRLQLL